jgi:hypothetical protein
LKSKEFYTSKNDKFLFDQVNIDGFLDGLKEQDEQCLEDVFEDKPIRKPQICRILNFNF